MPSFPGLHGHQQAIDAGVKVTGCTVHFVDGGMDTGPIIMQNTVPVYPDDTGILCPNDYCPKNMRPIVKHFACSVKMHYDRRTHCTLYLGGTMIQNALLSVSDKTGIVDFAKGLVDLRVTIYSTGGTLKAISDAGVPAKAVESLTGFLK